MGLFALGEWLSKMRKAVLAGGLFRFRDPDGVIGQ